MAYKDPSRDGGHMAERGNKDVRLSVLHTVVVKEAECMTVLSDLMV